MNLLIEANFINILLALKCTAWNNPFKMEGYFVSTTQQLFAFLCLKSICIAVTFLQTQKFAKQFKEKGMDFR